MTKKAFVIGWPVEQSLSPIVHGYWLKEMGLEGCYEKIAVEPENLNAFLQSIEGSGFVGGNVTVPHKESVFGTLSRTDDIADALEAVNTLWLEGSELFGSNTDAYGFSANMDELAPTWRTGKTAIVVGAGGSARAVLWSLKQVAYDTIHILNRTILNAQILSQKFGTGFFAHGFGEAQNLLRHCDLLVNTTTMTMGPDGRLPFEISSLPKHAIVCDIVYHPLQTVLLKEAATRGIATVDGLGMLLHQAVPGFEKWFGARPVVSKKLRDHIVSNHL